MASLAIGDVVKRRPFVEVFPTQALVPLIGPHTDSVFVDGRPVRELFDTGGAGAFIATRRLVERAGLRPIQDSGRATIGLMSSDTAARQVVRFTRVARVALGPFGVDSPRVVIAPPLLGGEDACFPPFQRFRGWRPLNDYSRFDLS